MIAVDLPISNPDAGAAAYADVVVEAIRSTSAPVIVGHSMGGLVIPLVAERRPVSRLVFLAGFLPLPGISANQQRDAEPVDSPVAPTTAEWTDLGNDVWMVGPNTATEVFFHDAPSDVAAWAVSRFRPQAYRAMNEPSPLTRWPDVPATYVVCRQDRALNPDWARGAARARLGVDALEIDGAHSPFMTRPAELAEMLDPVLRGPG